MSPRINDKFGNNHAQVTSDGIEPYKSTTNAYWGAQMGGIPQM